jgi:hypothetical protein
MTNREATVDRVLSLSEQLSTDEQLRVITVLSERLRHAAEDQEPVDMRSLTGLGAEMWQQIDVDAYLQHERESWER